MLDLLVRNVRLDGRDGLFQICVKDGIIVGIMASNAPVDQAARVIDAAGALALPPFVEPHIHLDAALTAGEPRWNESGTLFEGIQRWAERKPMLSRDDVKRRARMALQWLMAHGVLHVRSHVDVTDPGLVALQALLEIKQEIAPWMTLQLVAFPQEGIYSYNRGQGRELLEEALRMGADVVGAIPHYEYTREYGVASIDFCFDMAAKYGRPIDVHCDEIDDEQSRFVEVVAARALETGMAERVTVSHTTAMHSYNGAYAYKLFGLLQKANINFVANPLVNVTLQGRFDTYPKRRGLTRIKELLAAGINVCLGHDDIMDPWYSLGTGNMLQVASMAIHAAHMTGREEVMQAVDMITWRSAHTLGISSEYGIEIGKPANFNLILADDKWDLMRRMPPCRYVISRGRVVAETPTVYPEVTWNGRRETVDFRKPQ